MIPKNCELAQSFWCFNPWELTDLGGNDRGENAPGQMKEVPGEQTPQVKIKQRALSLVI